MPAAQLHRQHRVGWQQAHPSPLPPHLAATSQPPAPVAWRKACGTAARRCKHLPARAEGGEGSLLEQVHQLTFPHKGWQTLENGKQVPSQEVIRLLEPYMTPERLVKLRAVSAKRNYSLLPILENTYDMGNLAACCRSADAFGFGALHHIRRSDSKYKQSGRTSAGAEKWLDVQIWDSTAQCVEAVKAAGLQLVVTHLSKSSVTLQEIDFTRPTAIVFGNEKFGATDEIVAAADACAIIPMAGLVESFNISVAFALAMYEARQQITRAARQQASAQVCPSSEEPAAGEVGEILAGGDLSLQQQEDLLAALAMRSVREPELLIRELMSRPPPSWQAGRFRSKTRTLEGAANRALETAVSPAVAA